jgi:Acetyl-coenzyme A synthetase N-terminus
MTNPHADEPQSDVFRVARRFDPFESFVASANAHLGIYQEADRDWVGFWEQQAKRLSWGERWEKPLYWAPPFAQWFVGMAAGSDAIEGTVGWAGTSPAKGHGLGGRIPLGRKPRTHTSDPNHPCRLG